MSSERHFQKATIKEVAALAGVSITTVSLFVKGRESVCSSQTGNRIRKAIAELNYTPSALTRGLHSRASKAIGVCLPHPLDLNITYGVSFFDHIWRGIIHQADLEDYSLLHYPISVRYGRSCDAFLDGRVDGLLLLEHENFRSPRLVAAGMPTVLLFRSEDVVDGCSSVYTDENQVVDHAMSHLWDLGHRRIAHIAGPVDQRPEPSETYDAGPDMPHDDVASRRLSAYIRWMDGRESYDPSYIGYGKTWRGANIDKILCDFMSLSSPPTAIFCANDQLAVNVCDAARAVGIMIPDDLSVVGVDNSGLAESNVPALTSVDTQTHLVGQEAVKELVRLLRSNLPIDQSVSTAAGELIVRRSTARLAGRQSGSTGIVNDDEIFS